MLHFFTALTVFLLSHSVIARSGLRRRITALTGETRYLLLYSLLSTALLVWLLTAAIHAPRIPLWPWAHWTYWIPNIFMPPAFILLFAGFVTANPLSISLRQGAFDPEKPPVTIALTRHPVMWGFFLWAAAHVPPNGEFPVGFMFLLFAGFALAGLKLIDRKYIKKTGRKDWEHLSKNTHPLLFCSSALRNGNFTVTKYDILGLCAGLAFYMLFYSLHGYFFGINPVPPL